MKKEIKEKIREYIMSKITDDIPDCSIKLRENLLNEILFKKTMFCKKIALPNSVMRKLDLSDIDFTDVLVKDVDFTNTNAIINPQTVYHKNMINGKYPLNFTGKSFDGAVVAGADFTGATNVNMDPQTVFMKCMVCGCYPFDFTDKSFEGVDVRGSDFTGATNAEIYNNINILKKHIDKAFERKRK